MAGDQVQFRGGTQAECDAFTPAAREIIIDTTNKRPRLGDGATLGGIPLLAASDLVAKGTYFVGSTGGTANAITLTVLPAPAALAVGMTFSAFLTTTNTGAVTLAVNGGTAYAVKDLVGNALLPGHLTSGQRHEFTWTGTQFVTTREAPNTYRRLAEYSPTGTPTYITFALPAGYGTFRVEFAGIAPTASGLMFCQLSNDGGGTYLSTGTDYTAGWYGGLSPGYGAAANASSFTASLSVLAGGSGGVLGGELDIRPAVAAAYGTLIQSRLNYTYSVGPALMATTFHGNCTSTAARPNAIRIGFASTTFLNQGKAILSGIPA